MDENQFGTLKLMTQSSKIGCGTVMSRESNLKAFGQKDSQMLKNVGNKNYGRVVRPTDAVGVHSHPRK